MIPRIKPIEVTPRKLNARLLYLHGKEIAGTLTAAEKLELDALCKALEGGQDL